MFCFETENKTKCYYDALLLDFKPKHSQHVYIFMDKSSAWSNFVLPSLKGFHSIYSKIVKNLDIETEQSEQTLFKLVYLF